MSRDTGVGLEMVQLQNITIEAARFGLKDVYYQLIDSRVVGGRGRKDRWSQFAQIGDVC